MMSGVPAAAIRPMKAMFDPIAIMFRVVMKNGEIREKTTRSRM